MAAHPKSGPILIPDSLDRTGRRLFRLGESDEPFAAVRALPAAQPASVVGVHGVTTAVVGDAVTKQEIISPRGKFGDVYAAKKKPYMPYDAPATSADVVRPVSMLNRQPLVRSHGIPAGSEQRY